MTAIHLGSLQVAPAARDDVLQAMRYLARDPVERALFDRVERAPLPVRIVTNARGDDSYDPRTRTVHWDPHAALRTSGGGTQSPALGLGHEIDHAAEDPARAARLAAHRLAGYDNAEERRVIRGSERHAARTLGEAVRSDHRGSTYRVAAPTAMPLA